MPITREMLASYDALQAPVWVFDLDRGVKWWANRSAVQLWGAAGLDELLRRDASKQMSAATRTRLDLYRARFARGEVANERWTFYPDGHKPLVAECVCSGMTIADEDHGVRLAMLIEARLLSPGSDDPAERRGVEALRHSSELVTLYAREGRALMRNPAAVRALGEPAAPGAPTDELAAMFVREGEAARARAAVERGEVYRADVEIRAEGGVCVHHVEIRSTLDPVTGEPALLVNQRDVSERIRYTRALEESRQSLLDQAETLRALSSPVIRLRHGILALPFIGRISPERVDAAERALLERARAERVATVILDLTGAVALDAAAAGGVRDLGHTLGLLGIAMVLTGMSPTLAQTLCREGVKLAGIRAYQTVEHALAVRRAPGR